MFTRLFSVGIYTFVMKVVKNVFLLSLTGLIVSCATDRNISTAQVVFYPAPPEAPRIQHLLSLSSEQDLKKEKSGFADFILGDETDTGLVKKPYGVAFSKGKIYVVDTVSAGYISVELATGKKAFHSGSAGGRMQKPINITLDTEGNRYISDTGREQVLVFDNNDNFVKAYGQNGEFRPSDVAIIDNRIYVADLKNHSIQVLEKTTGANIGRFGKAGSKNGEFYYPTNLTVSSDGQLYVSDTGNFRVEVYSREGEYLRSYGSLGSGFGKFARPKGIALDRQNRLYAVDAAFENVQLFNDKARLLMYFSEAGVKPENINLPVDITIDYENADFFQQFADPAFKLEYIVAVTSQFGKNKINIFGFGSMAGKNYPE